MSDKLTSEGSAPSGSGRGAVDAATCGGNRARPPGPPDSPDRCVCGAVSCWRDPGPHLDPLTRIYHSRVCCGRDAGAAAPRSDTAQFPGNTADATAPIGPERCAKSEASSGAAAAPLADGTADPRWRTLREKIVWLAAAWQKRRELALCGKELEFSLDLPDAVPAAASPSPSPAARECDDPYCPIPSRHDARASCRNPAAASALPQGPAHDPCDGPCPECSHVEPELECHCCAQHEVLPAGWEACRIAREQAERERDEARAAKDGAYRERDRVVALASRMAALLHWPAWLGRHVDKPGDPPWEDDWRNIVFIDLPSGQVSWHIHDSEVGLFAFLPYDSTPWDGHDTAEKYRRCDAPWHRDPAAESTAQAERSRAEALAGALRGAVDLIEQTEWLAFSVADRRKLDAARTALAAWDRKEGSRG